MNEVVNLEFNGVTVMWLELHCRCEFALEGALEIVFGGIGIDADACFFDSGGCLEASDTAGVGMREMFQTRLFTASRASW